MTYVPPERGDEPALDQTRQLDVAPGPGLPAVGNGVDAQSAQPVDPFAGQAATTVGYVETPVRRDRPLFQFIWEGILLLLTLNALFFAYQSRDAVFGGEATMETLDAHLMTIASLVLIASGFGLSLRLGAVNLAVPALPALVVTMSPVFVGDNPLVGLALTAGAVAVLAILFTVLTALFRLPAWIAGLATLLVVGASYPAVIELAQRMGAPDQATTWTNPGELWLFVGAVAISVAGGLIGLLPSVRDRFSAVKSAVEGTGPRNAASVFTLLGGTFLSLMLGALAGFVPVVFGSGVQPTSEWLLLGSFSVSTVATVMLSPVALIVVFLAGTSPWGRRGGVFGTSLAAVTVWALIMLWPTFEAPASNPALIEELTGVLYVGLLLLGLTVSYGLDRLGEPKEVPEPETPVFNGEMPPFDSPQGGVNDSGLFEPTLPDATGAPR